MLLTVEDNSVTLLENIFHTLGMSLFLFDHFGSIDLGQNHCSASYLLACDKDSLTAKLIILVHACCYYNDSLLINS